MKSVPSCLTQFWEPSQQQYQCLHCKEIFLFCRIRLFVCCHFNRIWHLEAQLTVCMYYFEQMPPTFVILFSVAGAYGGFVAPVVSSGAPIKATAWEYC